MELIRRLFSPQTAACMFVSAAAAEGERWKNDSRKQRQRSNSGTGTVLHLEGKLEQYYQSNEESYGKVQAYAAIISWLFW